MEQDITKDFQEMVSILNQINIEKENPVDEEIIIQILALTIKNPLDSDRSKCQQQIHELIKQKRW